MSLVLLCVNMCAFKTACRVRKALLHTDAVYVIITIYYHYALAVSSSTTATHSHRSTNNRHNITHKNQHVALQLLCSGVYMHSTLLKKCVVIMVDVQVGEVESNGSRSE
jgi:hypothetical protein